MGDVAFTDISVPFYFLPPVNAASFLLCFVSISWALS